MAGFDLPCDWKSGFLMDPLNKQRVGYLTTLKCIDLDEALSVDVTAFTPFPADAGTFEGFSDVIDENKVKVVGVIDSFSFAGGVGDPICISAYVSTENANMLSGKTKDGVKTTKVNELGWWIVNYDTEKKSWYEEAHPKGKKAITGQLNERGGVVSLKVAPQPTKITANIDVSVVNIYLEVIPAANAVYDLHFAESQSTKLVRNWGLKVGESALSALPDTA